MASRLILVTGGADSGRLRVARSLASRPGGRILSLAFGSPPEKERLPEEDDGPDPAVVVEGPSALAKAWRQAGLSWDVLLLHGLDTWVEKQLRSAGEAEAVLGEVQVLVAFARTAPQHTVVVSREAGSGVVPVWREERLYRDTLGWVNQTLAQAADEVWVALAGLPFRLK